MGNTCGVYMIRNKINKKSYIGSSVMAKNRLNGHKSLLRRNKHYNQNLQNEYNEYGLAAFEFIIIENGIDPKDLINREEYYIEKTKSNVLGHGYNIRKVADSNIGVKLSQKSRERIRDSKLGVNNPFYKKHHTKESREKMSEAHKGDKAYWYGKKLPDSLIKKRSLSFKGKLAGERNPSSKINYQIACDIRKLLSDGTAAKIITTKYGISKSTVYNIKLYRSWTSP